MRFGHVMVFVSEKEQARQFYSEVLELELVDEDEKRLIYEIGGQKLVLFETERSVEPVGYSEEARTVLVFAVDDVDESFQNLKARGVHFLHSHPTPKRYAAFVDPFGNVHEILEDDKA